jgi:CBS-domain-containing membrane protein
MPKPFSGRKLLGCAREVFAHVDLGLFMAEHQYARTGLLRLLEDAAGVSAHTLMKPLPRAISEDETLAEAMKALYGSDDDELPVMDAEGKLTGVVRALDIFGEWVEDTLLKLGDETESFY